MIDDDERLQATIGREVMKHTGRHDVIHGKITDIAPNKKRFTIQWEHGKTSTLNRRALFNISLSDNRQTHNRIAGKATRKNNDP